MLAITKFMTDRLIANKMTTAKDIASKFKTQNLKVAEMLKEAQVSGEMLLAINTEHLMAKTQVAIVSLGLDVAQDLGIADDFGKPAGFHLMDIDEEIQIMAKKAKVADVVLEPQVEGDGTGESLPEIELDESGAVLGGTDTADGEGAVGTEQWYEGAVDSTELPPVVKAGRKTRSPEEIQAELDAKAARKAEKEAEKAAKKAERETAKAEAQAQRNAQRDAQRAERERKAAERRAQIAEGGPGLCRVCHKPLNETESVARGIGPVCMGRLARFGGTTVAALTSEETTSEDTLTGLVAQYAEKGSPVEVFATEADALAAHPEGIVKFSEFYKAVNNAGINPRRLMKATGGDRSEGEVLGEIWMPFIIGTTRKYLSKLVEENMDQLRPQEVVEEPVAE